MFVKTATVALAFLSHIGLADDPAPGWLGYATAKNPNGGDSRITFIEAYWVNCDDPKVSGAFFSPWFGIESSDNKNLIQPVNPWSSDSWSIYNEYFQWDPEKNENSRSHNVKAGDVLYGSVTYNDGEESYTVYHSDLTDGWSVSTTIDVQESVFNGYKNYTMSYFVFEKVAKCAQYPPDGKVTFYNISIYWDGKKESPSWTTAYVDDYCNNRAKVVDESTIEITWDTTDGYDIADQDSKKMTESTYTHGKDDDSSSHHGKHHHRGKHGEKGEHKGEHKGKGKGKGRHGGKGNHHD